VLSGVASTALAAQVYGDMGFTTVHTGFAIPVDEDDEVDANDEPGSNFIFCLHD